MSWNKLRLNMKNKSPQLRGFIFEGWFKHS